MGEQATQAQDISEASDSEASDSEAQEATESATQAVPQAVRKLRGENQSLRKRLRETEQRLKELEKSAKELDRIKRKQMEEEGDLRGVIEKLQQDLAAAQDEAVRLRADNMRARIGTELEIPPDLWDMMPGDDEDTIREAAQKLARYVSQTPQQPDEADSQVQSADTQTEAGQEQAGTEPQEVTVQTDQRVAPAPGGSISRETEWFSTFFGTSGANIFDATS